LIKNVNDPILKKQENIKKARKYEKSRRDRKKSKKICMEKSEEMAALGSALMK